MGMAPLKDHPHPHHDRNGSAGGTLAAATDGSSPLGGKKSVAAVLPRATRVLLAGILLTLVGGMLWWQSVSWCDMLDDNPELYRNSTAHARDITYLNFVYCAFTRRATLSYLDGAGGAGAVATAAAALPCNGSSGAGGGSEAVQGGNPGMSPDREFWAMDMSDDGPNVASWKSQWQHKNLSWAQVERHMVPLTGDVFTSALTLVNTRSAAYDGQGCGLPASGPVLFHVNSPDGSVEYGTVECPVFWQCRNAQVAPRMAAVCWDSKFYDPPYPASLPTELGPGFTTPGLGDKPVNLNYEFRGGVLFMTSVYSNWQAQLFDDKLLFLKGGCGETSPDLYLHNQSVVTRHPIVINMAHSLAYNQYHGLIELFSRWAVMLPVIKALQPAVPVLVTRRDVGPMTELLQFVGLNFSDLNVTYITRYNPRNPKVKPEAVYADMMIIPHSPLCSTTSGAVWDHIRQHYFRIPYTRETPMERDDSWYLVLAERTKSRGIIEHDALLAGLVSLLGPDKVKVFSDTRPWSKQQQLELFRNAAVYVASHGAGLANMVFMPFHSSVIEVRPTGWSNRCYHYVADMMRFPFYRFDSPGVKASNLTVDVQRVVALVSAIVEAKGHHVPFYPLLQTPITKGRRRRRRRR